MCDASSGAAPISLIGKTMAKIWPFIQNHSGNLLVYGEAIGNRKRPCLNSNLVKILNTEERGEWAQAKIVSVAFVVQILM